MKPNLLNTPLQIPSFGGPVGNPKGPAAHRPWWLHTVITVVAIAALWLLDRSTFNFGAQARAWMDGISPGDGIWVLVGGALVYALLLSIPFVPGVELGLALMMVFGVPGVAMAYLGTIVGLSLAYGMGYWFSPTFLPGRAVSGSVSLLSVAAMRRMLERQPKLVLRLGALLNHHPHLVLAVLLNLPGNSLVGGGGGIGMLFGFTRAISWPAYLVTIAVSTAPVPFLFLMGWIAL